MNLFELFVKIGVDDQASGKLSNLSSKLGNGLKTAAKIGTAAVGAAAAGITALTTAAVNNYAEYEQLVGGAELMFGDAFHSVMNNAQEAYKTVQMSQNEYLQQVNGFATGLKTALGGNEQAAADLAHRIIQAEADVVAATGNSQEAVQNAFNGIMKSNFTMLDNLQIGITPTKEGFQEVIDKVNEWNKANGNATKYQMGNLADMQSALVDYIDMVGMSGYAQAEAAGTITGSVASTKAAWSDFLTSLADENADYQYQLDNLLESVKTVATNVYPVVEQVLWSITDMVEDVLPEIAAKIPEIISEVLPRVTEIAVKLVESLINGISQNQEMLFTSIFDVVTYLADSFIGMLPEIVKLGLDLIVSLANGIAESLPELIPTIVDVILQIVDTLTAPDTLSNLLEAAIAIIIALADGLIESLPELIEKAPEIVQNLVDAIIDNAPKLLESALILVLKLAEGILSNLPELVTSGIDMVSAVIEGIVELLGDLIMKGKDIVDSVKSGFSEKVEDAKTWGKDLIDNFIGGITEKWNALKEKVSSVAQTVKDYLGFSEPKKGPLSNFHTYAPDMMDLFIKGIKDNEKKLTDQIEKTFDFGERTITAGVSYGSYGDKNVLGNRMYGSNVSVVQNIYSEAKTAADLMQEALYQQERAVLVGV